MSRNIIITDNYTWTNEHNNVVKSVLRRYQINNDGSPGWRGGLEGIQSMIKEARSRNERIRSYGGKWSLSDVAVCNDSIHDTKPLVFFGTVGKNSIKGSALFKNDPKPLDERLYFFQSGCQINQINNILEPRGLCLATTGASNGQTIGGAVSTGTHGSALKIGAMQDYVRALHIVTSEKEHVFVQPKTNPIIGKSFSDIFGAKLISDDSIFNSALVSFGSFGVIHGIILETVSLFMLETHCMRVDYTKAATIYPKLVSFDHGSSTNLKKVLEKFGLKSKDDPYHLDIVVNPYSIKKNAFVRVMYKRPYEKKKLSPKPGSSGIRVGDDALSFFGTVLGKTPGVVSVVVNRLFGQFAEVQSGYTQTPRYIFGDSFVSKPGNGSASVELGVPVEKAKAAVQRIITTAKGKKFAGLIGIRFVKNSTATLAFTRFSPLTCTIELPGLNSDNTQNFYVQVFENMEKANIPFTLHWGQEGDYSPQRLDSMYGTAVETWTKDRERFLPDPVQRYMFTNDFLKRCGLSEPPALTDGGVL